jgi:hypothetical protein
VTKFTGRGILLTQQKISTVNIFFPHYKGLIYRRLAYTMSNLQDVPSLSRYNICPDQMVQGHIGGHSKKLNICLQTNSRGGLGKKYTDLN